LSFLFINCLESKTDFFQFPFLLRVWMIHLALLYFKLICVCWFGFAFLFDVFVIGSLFLCWLRLLNGFSLNFFGGKNFFVLSFGNALMTEIQFFFVLIVELSLNCFLILFNQKSSYVVKAPFGLFVCIIVKPGNILILTRVYLMQILVLLIRIFMEFMRIFKLESVLNNAWICF
jgi:hypothetical protein